MFGINDGDDNLEVDEDWGSGVEGESMNEDDGNI